jgi:U6 snRNA-associated Sm-like protein LSm7
MGAEKVCAACKAIRLLIHVRADFWGDIVTGILKGYDALMNLVLDDVQEVLRGEDLQLLRAADPATLMSGSSDDEGNESSRALGLVVARGTLLVLVSPVDGSEEIANPFVQQED